MSSTKGHMTVRKNTGADVGTERRINFIEGANVTMTIADDPANHEVDVTINSGAGVANHASTHEDLGADEIDVGGLSGELADAQPVSVSKNSGAVVGTQPEINLIEGANITLTIADDGPNNEVDVTIAAAGAGGAITASATRTVTAGNLTCGGWNHAQATEEVCATPLEEPESFWWMSIDDVNNITMHIASVDLENNHTFKVLVF